ncbi:MAG: hypothetical protein E7L00_09735 [Propionibacteriaceae bacterium]|nr:hypothetical protein [Propionibacteriaceae bacterium]
MTQTEPKEIATLPPIEELRDDVALSPRTGEPRRPAVLVVASVLMYLAVAVVAWSYGWHWYRTAYPETYLISAHLTGWVEPEPGKWFSLFLEFVYAGLTALAGGAAGVVGFQAWNGHRWSRIGAGVAAVLAGIVAVLMNLYALIAVGLVVAGGVLFLLPPVTRYFREWRRVRSHEPSRYSRPERIFYGRLPRFR